MKRFSVFILALILFIGINSAEAQILKPVKWSYGAKKLNKTEAVVFIKATLEKGWHIYSQNMGEGGPVPTTFSFNPSKGYALTGKTIEPAPLSKFEKTFNMKVSYFDNSVVFQQKVKLNSPQATVSGTVEFMACNDHQCLPPEEVTFNIPVK